MSYSQTSIFKKSSSVDYIISEFKADDVNCPIQNYQIDAVEGVTQKEQSNVLCLSKDCRTFEMDATKIAVYLWSIKISALGGSELLQPAKVEIIENDECV